MRRFVARVAKAPLRAVKAVNRRTSNVVSEPIAGGLLSTGRTGDLPVLARLCVARTGASGRALLIARAASLNGGRIERLQRLLRDFPETFGRVLLFGENATAYAGRLARVASSVEAIDDRYALRDAIADYWGTSDAPAIAVVGATNPGIAWAVDDVLGTCTVLSSVGVRRRAMRVKTAHVEVDLVSGAGAYVVSSGVEAGDLVVPNTAAGMGVSTIAPGAFRGASLTSILAPAPLRTIGAEAFAGCSDVTRVVLPGTLRYVGASAFEGAAALERIHIPNGVHTIGPWAFAGCGALRKVVLPESLVTIADDAFVGAHPELEFHAPEGSEAYRWASERGRVVSAEPAPAAETLETVRVTQDGVEYAVLPGGMVEACRVDDSVSGVLELPAEVHGHAVRGIGHDFVGGKTSVSEIVLPASARWVSAHAIARPVVKRVRGARNLQWRGRGTVQKALIRFNPRKPIDADSVRLTMRMLAELVDIDVPADFADDMDEPYPSLASSVFTSGVGSLYFASARELTPDVVDRLVGRGVRAFVSDGAVRDGRGEPVPQAFTDDPRRAFESACAWIARQHSVTTIAITGSVGKTSTKEMIRHVCESALSVHYSTGNQNGPAQVARHAQNVTDKHDVFIQETGAAYPGIVERGARILRANGFVITNIGLNHVGNYGGSQERLLADKLSHDRHMPEDGVAFVNLDDPKLREVELTHRIISYAVDARDADYFAEDVVEEEGTVRFQIVESSSGERTPVVVNAVGRHNVSNAVVAFAVGRWLDVPVRKIVEGIGSYEGEGLRQNLTEIGGRRVLIDCYNASEVAIGSTADALQAISVPEGGRRIYVVADIDDKLGSITEEVHRRVGVALAEADGIDRFYLFGAHAAWIAEELTALGRDAVATTDRDELTERLRDDLREDDLVAFKGGQQMALSITIDTLFGTAFVLSDGDVLEKRGTNISDGGMTYRLIDEYGAQLRKVPPEFPGTSLVVEPVIDGVPVYMVGRSACSNSPLVEASIPEPVRTIARAAFFRNRALERIDLPATLLHIGQSAFNGCSSLREIVVPEGVTTIGHRAFFRCTSLERLVLPASVRTIDPEAFRGCTAVTIECPAGSYAESFVREHYRRLAVAST
ncbi:MAG: leucine-rich repeat protein [Microbacterium sp.]